MTRTPEPDATPPLADERAWRWIVLFAWLLLSAAFVWQKWAQIHWFALGDTDDNMRLMQVRALLSGQGWYDLRQYRLDPPLGADIHWSRWVDLPIAGLILLFRPFVGGFRAEQIAVAVAPLIPMLVAFAGLAVAMRRLVGAWSYIVALAIFVFCITLNSMFVPTRIDHHGWQLALLPWLIAGMADPNRARGGLTIGLASALSLVIGLEMMPYLALAGGASVLRWVADAGEQPRVRSYALALAGATTIGFLIFASEANRAARCDALSPVWLSAMLGAGGLLFAASWMTLKSWQTRLAASLIIGVLLAAGFAWAWPHCLGRLEGISPELDRLWFSHIREVKPLGQQNVETIATLAFSALIGPLGAIYGMKISRGAPNFGAWAATLLLSLAAAAMLFWQSRAGPAVQMLSIPGATALGWTIIPRTRASKSVLMRTLGTVAAFALVSGLAVQFALMMRSDPPPKPGVAQSSAANSRCATIPSLAPIARLPMGTVFTFADLSPRLIVLTHHDAIAGPYHRNQAALLDVHRAFRATPDAARAIVTRHRSDYVLICPGSSESTIYKADAPQGFYARLARGDVPRWLAPVTLPAGSPYQIWRIVAGAK